MIPYYNLFQYLQKNPNANYSQMAKELKITDKTAKAHYQYLVKNGYIIGIRAKYKPENIGLETNSYILSISDLKRVEIIEKLADFHYFTTFRNRILGSVQGLFLQFDVPATTSKYLDALFLKLQEYNIIEQFEKIPSLQIKIITKPEFRFFDNKIGKWTWEIDSWEKKYQTSSTIFSEEPQKKRNFMKQLRELDLKLLFKLTSGTKVPHVKLAKELDATSVQITRRINFLNENILNYRLLYTRSKIQPVDLVLFRCKCSEVKKNKLYNLITKHPIPFDTGFEILDDGFMWRMNIPPSYVSQFGEFLWSICVKLQFYHFDHSKSMLYYFYDGNYDLEKKIWKATKTELYDLPLKWLKENQK